MSLFETCQFGTDRLLVKEWHSAPGDAWPTFDLGRVVSELMTEPVTRHLPVSWRGQFSVSRARAWVAERDDESPTLLVVDRTSAQPVGLVIVFESAIEPGGAADVRLGYLLAEVAWGQGLATELLAGFVDWCRARPTIHTITAGVAPTNRASRRVLERLGFVLVTNPTAEPDDELLYRLTVAAT